MSHLPYPPPDPNGQPPIPYPPAPGDGSPYGASTPSAPYPPADQNQPYPPPYPPPQSGFPSAYPPAAGGYPPPQGGYPPPQGGYPPPPGPGGYPPPQNSTVAPGYGGPAPGNLCSFVFLSFWEWKQLLQDMERKLHQNLRGKEALGEGCSQAKVFWERQ